MMYRSTVLAAVAGFSAFTLAAPVAEPATLEERDPEPQRCGSSNNPCVISMVTITQNGRPQTQTHYNQPQTIWKTVTSPQPGVTTIYNPLGGSFNWGDNINNNQPPPPPQPTTVWAQPTTAWGQPPQQSSVTTIWGPPPSQGNNNNNGWGSSQPGWGVPPAQGAPTTVWVTSTVAAPTPTPDYENAVGGDSWCNRPDPERRPTSCTGVPVAPIHTNKPGQNRGGGDIGP